MTNTLGGGRPLTAGVAMLATAVAVVSLLVGGLLAAVSLTGHVFGAWPSPESVSPGLIGAPGLFTVGRARLWEEARTLVYPLGIVLIGLFTVTLLNAGRLYIARGGSIIPVLFSLGWLFTLGLLCVAALITLTWQHLNPADPPPPRTTPLGPALGLLCTLTGLLFASGRLLLGSVSGDRRAVAAAGAVRRGTPR